MQIEYNKPRQIIQTGSDDWIQGNEGLYSQTRINFIRKVYSILTVQLIFTAIVTGIVMLFPAVLEFQIENVGLFYLNFIVMFIIEIVIFCCPAGRKHPTNLILLGLFTLCESYVVSFFCSFYMKEFGGYLITQAVAITALMVAGLTVFALTTKKDFTIYLGLMFVLGISLFIMFLLILITDNEFLYNVYLTLGVFFFGAYVVIDTQLIIGGKRYQLSLDEYVVGALFLYIDIIALFLRILILLGKARR